MRIGSALTLDGVGHAFWTICQAVEERPAKSHALRAEAKGFDNVGPSANPAVEIHLRGAGAFSARTGTGDKHARCDGCDVGLTSHLSKTSGASLLISIRVYRDGGAVSSARPLPRQHLAPSVYHQDSCWIDGHGARPRTRGSTSRSPRCPSPLPSWRPRRSGRP